MWSGSSTPSGPLAPVRAFANKVPEHAARLGGVLALVEQLDADEVSSHHLEAGILLAEHYAAEARRLHEAGQSDPELDLAQRVLDWLAGEWPGRPLISAPDLYTFGPNPVRDKKTSTRIVGILEDHGWLVRQVGSARVNGTVRRECGGWYPGLVDEWIPALPTAGRNANSCARCC